MKDTSKKHTKKSVDWQQTNSGANTIGAVLNPNYELLHLSILK